VRDDAAVRREIVAGRETQSKIEPRAEANMMETAGIASLPNGEVTCYEIRVSSVHRCGSLW
jgi:hypothetical protein